MKKILLAVLLISLVAIADEEKKEFEVKEIEPFWYCALDMKGSYDKHEEAFQTLYNEASVQGLGADFIAFGIYYDDPSQVAPEDLTWELGFELEEKVELKEPLVLKKWDYTLVVSSMYEGVFSDEAFGAAHQKLFEWIGQNGYTPAGPMMEKFIAMPTQTSEGSWEGKINMVMPVQKN
ncbi:GyrI-like domain-containing protein [candidate division KSB1 bacterium]|nr:GyrI-like domain-containing protein [candidate division KSB1 bacterium]